ncbi:MAG: type II secretion system protein [Parcubacteria group bacterium]
MLARAFTTAESLMVVATIGILSAVIVIAVTADKRLVDTRNTQRRTDVATIISAVTRYSIDHNGILPKSIPADSREICQSEVSDCTGLVDLSVLTEKGQYLVYLPADPQSGSANGTGYSIKRIGANRIQVAAPLAEWGVVITEVQ